MCVFLVRRWEYALGRADAPERIGLLPTKTTHLKCNLFLAWTAVAILSFGSRSVPKEGISWISHAKISEQMPRCTKKSTKCRFGPSFSIRFTLYLEKIVNPKYGPIDHGDFAISGIQKRIWEPSSCRHRQYHTCCFKWNWYLLKPPFPAEAHFSVCCSHSEFNLCYETIRPPVCRFYLPDCLSLEQSAPACLILCSTTFRLRYIQV